nr:putative disease resistance protein At3g14460 [Ziziphus jujuba var. spinosa]
MGPRWEEDSRKGSAQNSKDFVEIGVIGFTSQGLSPKTKTKEKTGKKKILFFVWCSENMVIPAKGGSLPMSCLKTLDSVELVDFIEEKEAMKKQFQKLKTMLLSFNNLLSHAMEMQIRNPDVDMWVSDVEDVMYDVQDLLDEIETEALRCKLARESQDFFSINQVLNSMSTPFNVETVYQGLLEIIVKLESLLELKDGLALKEFEFEDDYVQPKSLPETKLMENSAVDDQFSPPPPPPPQKFNGI